MMLRSWSNTLVSVRQVAQRNAGRKTAGIDGQVALTSPVRAERAVRTHRMARSWKPLAVKRVFIPKAKGKQRPLGIPVLADRVHQARHRNALEPEWEARFEPRSYGFRPGRSCQDAISVIHVMACGKTAKRLWVLDADLSAAFDRIDHDRLLAAIGSFPGRGMIRDWLRAGVFKPGKGFAPTEQGTPQGGVSTPPTQLAMFSMVALRVGAAGVLWLVAGAFADGDAVSDGDLLASDEDVFDEEPQDSLA
jgi:RNA-directed DNA polymerase